MRSPLFLALVLSVSRPLSTPFLSANAALVNRTIDDSDIGAITYTPSANWHPSNNLTCSGCIVPDSLLAFRQTFHYGFHSAPPPDADDAADPDDDEDPDGSDDKPPSSNKGEGKSGGKRNLQMAKWRREPAVQSPDPDDPNFVDVNVTASLNFTGSAFYVYCVLPVQSKNASVLSNTNLTFILNGQRVGTFTHNPKNDGGSDTGFQYQIPVFFKDDLAYAQHALDIRAELGSMVILDYVQYSTLDSDSSTSVVAATPSGAIDSQTKSGGESKKNAATFGAAIGCTVGVLALVSLGVFISLYRRRRRSARRLKRFEAEESARPASPEMRGPQPFIPRYFPGTAAPHSPPSASTFPSLSGSGGSEELGPSHGLDLPPAPEHAQAPAYTPPPLVFSERTMPTRVAVSIPPLSARFPSPDVPPSYQDVQHSPIVPIPVFTPPPVPPPGMAESPSSVRSLEGWGSPTSTTALSPGRPIPGTSADERPR